MLFLSACNAAEPPKEPQRLTVESAHATLTSEQRDEMTSITVEIFCSALYSAEGMVLSTERRAALSSFVAESIIPLLEETLSYEDFKELSVLNFDIADPHALFNTYLSVASVLDAEKAGRLFYGFAMLYFEQSRRSAAEEYEKYGNSWNLEDAQKYERQYEELSSRVDPDDFTLVMGMMSLLASSVDVFGDLDEMSAFDADKGSYLLTVMRRQAALLQSADHRESLACAGKLVLEFIFGEMNAPEEFTTLQANEWYALAKSGDAFYELCLTLPALFELYSAFADALTPAEAGNLLAEDARVREETVVTVLGRCEDELTAWIESLSACTLAGAREQAVIERSGEAENFAAYAACREEVTPQELVSAVANFGDAFDGILEDFMFSVAPYATYVYYGRG